MRFKIDENLPDALVLFLSEKGHDACTARQQKLNGRSDQELGAACKLERRAIITLDLDFSDITTFPPEEFAGIIVLRVRRQDRDHILSVARELLTLLDTEPLDGHLWIVEETQVRVWRRW